VRLLATAQTSEKTCTFSCTVWNRQALSDSRMPTPLPVGRGGLTTASRVLSTSSDTVLLLGVLVLVAIFIGWVIASDHARRNAVAQAWLTAYRLAHESSGRARASWWARRWPRRAR
jgi:hypothetical protein